MNLLKLSKPLINLRSYATKRYVPKKPYRSAYTDENLTTKPKLDADTIEILEKLSLVGKLTEKNIKTVEDAIAFADVVLKVDTKRVDPLYTVLEDWPLHVREDEVFEDVCFYDLVKNAKRFEEDYFVAPAVNVPIDPKKISDA